MITVASKRTSGARVERAAGRRTAVTPPLGSCSAAHGGPCIREVRSNLGVRQLPYLPTREAVGEGDGGEGGPPAARGTPAAPSGRGVRLRRPRPPCHYM